MMFLVHNTLATVEGLYCPSVSLAHPFCSYLTLAAGRRAQSPHTLASTAPNKLHGKSGTLRLGDGAEPTVVP
jgi:hypothetical protein